MKYPPAKPPTAARYKAFADAFAASGDLADAARQAHIPIGYAEAIKSRMGLGAA